MKNELYSQINNLSRKLNEFYDEEYSSEHDEYIANKEIKIEIIDFIVKSYDLNESGFVQEALCLLSDNTGCQEDVEILDEIISPLIEKNIIDNDVLKKIHNDSPVSRWK